MTWKYQLAKQKYNNHNNEEHWQYGVVELYVDGDKEGWTGFLSCPIVVSEMDEGPEDLITSLKRIVNDLEKDLENNNILDIDKNS